MSLVAESTRWLKGRSSCVGFPSEYCVMGEKKSEMAAGGRSLSNGVSELKFSCQIRKACRIIDDAFV